MTDGQIHPLKKSCVQPPREAQSLQGYLEGCACSQVHHMRNPYQLAPLVAFFHLPIDQSCCHLPPTCFPPLVNHVEPLSKMGSQGVEVHIKTITGEKREAARSQEVVQGVDDHVRRILCAGAEVEHGKNL